MNTIKKLQEEVNFRTKVMNLVKGFQDAVKATFDGKGYYLPKINQNNELAYRLWNAVEHIKDFNYRKGYVVLDDDTIICVSSSGYIAQYDGCKVWEIGS